MPRHKIKISVAVLTNIPSPYRQPLWAFIDKDEDTDLEVWYAVGGNVGREWIVKLDQDVHRTRFFKNFGMSWKRRGGDTRYARIAPGVLWKMLWSPPDVLVIGDASWSSLIATVGCLIRRRPSVIWSESVEAPKSRIKRWIQKFGFSRAVQFIVPGDRSSKFLQKCGVDENDIVIAPQSTDTAYWKESAAQLLPNRKVIRTRFGYQENTKIILYVGGLWPRKRPFDLLNAFEKILRRGLNARLVMVGGDTESQKIYSDHAKHMNVSESVDFYGFMQPENLATHFAAADCLALVSDHEPWGYVVNEAFYFGVPVVVSDAVAAGDNLVRSATGAVSKVGDVDSIANALEHVIVDRDQSISVLKMKELLDQHSPENQAERFLHAVRQAYSCSI